MRKGEKLTVVNHYAKLAVATRYATFASGFAHGSDGSEFAPPEVPMIWFLPVTILIIGAGAFVRARLRARSTRPLTTEPVSGQWLAEARSREEQTW